MRGCRIKVSKNQLVCARCHFVGLTSGIDWIAWSSGIRLAARASLCRRTAAKRSHNNCRSTTCGDASTAVSNTRIAPVYDDPRLTPLRRLCRRRCGEPARSRYGRWRPRCKRVAQTMVNRNLERPVGIRARRRWAAPPHAGLPLPLLFENLYGDRNADVTGRANARLIVFRRPNRREPVGNRRRRRTGGIEDLRGLIRNPSA